ncbi:uncharacterized protein EV420DRAFT_1486172 [Desarmillaria tabescens]|uniref:Uncharacterized protein n=1 Tax=Armillaria tabescens TaxID=1929756 RepID=A0AA39JE81_ARMTA|nr:uncharacterized protein EV420DRAFT_1486172 [Desarmillaria tabescens]KAK0439719.1 hypothetical protein EV420DRAFT_1486172 [Desarmillaria tabescens]
MATSSTLLSSFFICCNSYRPVFAMEGKTNQALLEQLRREHTFDLILWVHAEKKRRRSYRWRKGRMRGSAAKDEERPNSDVNAAIAFQSKRRARKTDGRFDNVPFDPRFAADFTNTTSTFEGRRKLPVLTPDTLSTELFKDTAVDSVSTATNSSDVPMRCISTTSFASIKIALNIAYSNQREMHSVLSSRPLCVVQLFRTLGFHTHRGSPIWWISINGQTRIAGNTTTLPSHLSSVQSSQESSIQDFDLRDDRRRRFPRGLEGTDFGGWEGTESDQDWVQVAAHGSSVMRALVTIAVENASMEFSALPALTFPQHSDCSMCWMFALWVYGKGRREIAVRSRMQAKGAIGVLGCLERIYAWSSSIRCCRHWRIWAKEGKQQGCTDRQAAIRRTTKQHYSMPGCRLAKYLLCLPAMHSSRLGFRLTDIARINLEQNRVNKDAA